MSSLWPKVFLKEVLTERLEIPSEDAIVNGEIPIIAKIFFNNGSLQLRNESHTRTDLILIRPGDLVVSGINAAKGAIALYGEENPKPIAATIHYSAYIPNKNRVNIFYLWRFLRSRLFRDLLAEHMPGGIKTELNARRLLSIPIPLPSLEEQRRIVARIEELATKIEEAKGLRREAVEEAEKLIGLAVSDCFEKGVENGWIVRPLGNYVVSDCYGTSEKTTDDDSGIPILRMGNIQNGRIDLNDLKYLHLSDREKTKLLLAEGDILVNRTNSAELVGKCAVFDLEGDYGFASYLIRLRLDSLRAEPRLVARYINSPAGRNYMFNERKQMTGQANVNATKLKALPIALPSLSEQHRIVTYLNSLQSRVDSLKQLQSETSAELDALLPSILDKAFKGEL